MAVYGTKEYWAKEVAKAEARVELLTYGVVKKISKMGGKIDEAKELNAVCHTYTEAYADLETARRSYNECCSNESGS